MIFLQFKNIFCLVNSKQNLMAKELELELEYICVLMAKELELELEYICVLDFEATCWKNTNNHEIIEFPSVLLRWTSYDDIKEISRIQIFVKPKKNPVISDFCEKLTGITQEMIDHGKSLNVALKDHLNWLNKNTKNNLKKVMFVTCGRWDIETMLPMDLKTTGIKAHPVYKSFVNIKELFNIVTRKGKLSLVPMLEYFGLELEGRHHSGIDDCYNISRIFIELVREGLTKDDFTKHIINI